jgi:predicted phage baseplate assembly protein
MRNETPQMDEWNFQKLVDKAKELIPHYCPEWTDHNVSDPGVALIELFAWMTDLLIHRVNQTPDRMYLKFLEMIGKTLEPAKAATVPVTFYLSTPPSQPIPITTSVEVTTLRTETQDAITFTITEQGDIHPRKLVALYKRQEDDRFRLTGRWDRIEAHDLIKARETLSTDENGREQRQPVAIPLFPQRAALQDQQALKDATFYLQLDGKCSGYVLDIIVDSEPSKGTGISKGESPVRWEAYTESRDYEPCVVEFDNTEGFNIPGKQRIRLRLPRNLEETAGPTGPDGKQITGYWLRCSPVLYTVQNRDGATTQQSSFIATPRIYSLLVDVMGITLPAENATVVHDERLGFSTGLPGQEYKLRHAPVLDLEPGDYIRVIDPRNPGQSVEEQTWTPVQHFCLSKPGDRHFVIDNVNGRIQFGPALLLPDGKQHQFGKIPEKGHEIRIQRYRYGGGTAGNVAPGAIKICKSASGDFPDITNWEEGKEGSNAESVDHARFQAPEFLRKPRQAITASDYEALAQLDENVGRAKCIAPTSGIPIVLPLKDGKTEKIAPGKVYIFLVQKVKDETEAIRRINMSDEVVSNVQKALEERSLVGVQVAVYSAYERVARVRTTLVTNRIDHAALERQAQQKLQRYLNPFFGGPDGTGWPFGRPLYRSEVSGLLQQIPGVLYVQEAEIEGSDVSGILTLKPYEVVCSEQHYVTVKQAR